ncbi:MAG: hypothetical protein V1770_06175 [bacterium]
MISKNISKKRVLEEDPYVQGFLDGKKDSDDLYNHPRKHTKEKKKDKKTLKKQFQKISVLLLFSSTLILLGGCSTTITNNSEPIKSIKSENPSRSDIAAMIKGNIKDEIWHTMEIGGYKEEIYHFGAPDEVAKWLKNCYKENPEQEAKIKGAIQCLADKGMTNINPSPKENNCVEYDFTDKASPYLHKEEPIGTQQDAYYPIVAKTKDIKVTGMTEPADLFGKKIMTVKYALVMEVTDIGKCLYKDSDELVTRGNVKDQTGCGKFGDYSYLRPNGQGEATLVKYDDGWRIEKMSHMH